MLVIVSATSAAEANACSHSLTSTGEGTQREMNQSLPCRSVSNVPASQSCQRQRTRSSQISWSNLTDRDVEFTDPQHSELSRGSEVVVFQLKSVLLPQKEFFKVTTNRRYNAKTSGPPPLLLRHRRPSQPRLHPPLPPLCGR